MKNMVVDYLDKLEKLIEDGISVPVVGRKVINKIEALELIDQIRILLPDEMKQVIANTENNNATIKMAAIPTAEAKAKQELPANVEGHELVVAARNESLRILDVARKEATDIKSGAEDYVETTLSSLEDTLSRTARIVRKGIDELARRKNPNQP